MFYLNKSSFRIQIGLLIDSVLDHISDTSTFIGLCFAVRIVEAIGNAAFLTAAFAIIAAEFPDSIATTFVSLNV